MFGFVFGSICLFALVKVLRHGGMGPAFAYGGGCGRGHGGWGRGGYGGYGDTRHEGGPFGHDGWRGRHGGFRGPFAGRGRGFLLRGFFERLDTTPGQEKVILAALDELETAGRGVKDDVRGARSELATALRGESFDEIALGGATARIEGAVDSLRKAGIDAFAKIHGALDERQRGLLADWIERSPGGFGGFGPFR